LQNSRNCRQVASVSAAFSRTRAGGGLQASDHQNLRCRCGVHRLGFEAVVDLDGRHPGKVLVPVFNSLL
jgi:hypothetical protein